MLSDAFSWLNGYLLNTYNCNFIKLRAMKFCIFYYIYSKVKIRVSYEYHIGFLNACQYFPVIKIVLKITLHKELALNLL